MSGPPPIAVNWENLVEEGKEYRDHNTGELLDFEMVKAALTLEIKQMIEFKVFRWVPECEMEENSALLDTKWLDTRKSSALIRSRLVGRQYAVWRTSLDP